MSTLLVNDIINTDALSLDLGGRIVTATNYTSSKYQGVGDNGQTSQPTEPCLLEAFTFYKKFPKSNTFVWGLWCVNNLREGTQAQWYTCQKDGVIIGDYRLRHAVSGWSMGINSFTWTDYQAEQGNNTYSLVVKNYSSRIYYNYPCSNLSGSPNGSSTFLILEITH